MSIRHELETACRQLGLAFECQDDRTHPGHELTLDLSVDPPRLALEPGSQGEPGGRVLDLDVARAGLLFELTARHMEHEPTFDLWLELDEAERHLLERRSGRWQLVRVGADVTTVAAAQSSDRR